MSKPTPIRCLVIQLARLGDTLQSLMALRAAKQLYPQLEIHFLAREKFAHAAKRVPWISEVITLPTDQILGPILAGEKSEESTFKDLALWVAPLVQKPWEIVLNWSYSAPSSYLTALIPSRIKLGYTRRRDNSFFSPDGWSHYLQAIVQGGIPQNIHLTDVLTTQLLTALQIHVGDPLSDGNTAATSKTFFSLQLTEEQAQKSNCDLTKKWIAIQLGAGQESKTWDAQSWSQLIQLIIKRHPGWGVYLLGGKEDQPRANAIIEEITPLLKKSTSLISLVGETNFDLWASVVSKCQWLFSGDTAAIHLASVLGTRILNISVGPVRHLETGPYGNGHYVIASNLPCEACDSESKGTHTCRNSITPEAAYATWTYGSNEWAHRRQTTMETHFSQLGWTQHLAQVRIYRSKIRPGNDGGGVFYESITKHPIRMQDWTAMVMGQIARSWYCGWVPPVGQEILRESLSPSLVQQLRELKESTEVLSKICDQAAKTALTLNRKSSTLKSQKLMGVRDREELQELGAALSELESLIERLSKTHPPLLTFSQMSKVMMHHLKGSDLAELGRETAQCYRQLNEGVQIYRSWIKFTLELVKPIAIVSSNVTSIGSLRKPAEKELSP